MNNGMTTVALGVRERLNAAGAGIDRDATMGIWARALESHLSWLVKSGVLVSLHDDDMAVEVVPGALAFSPVVVVERLGEVVAAELDRWDGWAVSVTDTRPKKAKVPAVTPVVGSTTASPAGVTEGGDETSGG